MIDKNKIQARFKYYRQQIAELQQALEEASYYHEESISRQERRIKAYHNEEIERERQSESDKWYRDEQLRKATSDLERARSFDNEYEVDRAIKRLKQLQ